VVERFIVHREAINRVCVVLPEDARVHCEVDISIFPSIASIDLGNLKGDFENQAVESSRSRSGGTSGKIREGNPLLGRTSIADGSEGLLPTGIGGGAGLVDPRGGNAAGFFLGGSGGGFFFVVGDMTPFVS